MKKILIIIFAISIFQIHSQELSQDFLNTLPKNIGMMFLIEYKNRVKIKRRFIAAESQTKLKRKT